jgi:Zn-dependent peptidase ImmA (M78 family)
LRSDKKSFFIKFHKSFDEIRNKADIFRGKYWDPEKLPVDVENIIENKLNLEIVPINNFKRDYDIDSLLYNNFKSIAIDKDQYMNDNRQLRLRFSLAHEIGHIILHKDSNKEILNFSDINEWIQFIKEIPQEAYDQMEREAYEFAGRLLVPRNKLIESLTSQKDNIRKFLEAYPSADLNPLKKSVASKINSVFGVSSDVINKRFSLEKLNDFFKLDYTF